MLHLLAAHGRELSLADVAGSLGLAKPTAHGILRTLHDVGFVEQNRASGRYRLGPALLRLGTSYLDVNELRARAVNWADSLASASGESVRIGSLLENQVLIVHHVFRPDDSPQQLEVGATLPAHATALGKALLSYSPSAARGVPALPRYTRRTITSRRALTAALGEVRRRGYAVDLEEHTAGWAGVAAPIRGQGGLVVGSIGVAGPVDRLCVSTGSVREPIVAAVVDAAQVISRELDAGRR